MYSTVVTLNGYLELEKLSKNNSTPKQVFIKTLEVSFHSFLWGKFEVGLELLTKNNVDGKNKFYDKTLKVYRIQIYERNLDSFFISGIVFIPDIF